MNPDHFYIVGGKKVFDSEYKEITDQQFYSGIPRPIVPYPEFGEQFKPVIVGLECIQPRSYRNLMNYISVLADKQIDRLESLPSKQQKKEHLARTLRVILSVLSPSTPEETIFLGISRNVRTKDELLRQLEPILDKMVRHSKIREPRHDIWKYYLIAHDLKENDGYNKYSLINEVMTMAYSDIRRMDLKTGEDYYKAGKQMIESGYKKYLRAYR